MINQPATCSTKFFTDTQHAWAASVLVRNIFIWNTGGQKNFSSAIFTVLKCGVLVTESLAGWKWIKSSIHSPLTGQSSTDHWISVYITLTTSQSVLGNILHFTEVDTVFNFNYTFFRLIEGKTWSRMNKTSFKRCHHFLQLKAYGIKWAK